MAYDKSKRIEIQNEIIERISNGESLFQIIDKSDNMPSQRTIYEWLSSASKYYDKEFSQKYAHAREQRADRIFNEVLEIADDSSQDMYMDEEKGVLKVDHEHIQRSRLRVDARKWVLAKMMPNKYGEKKQLEIKQDTKITGVEIEVIKSNEKKG